MVDTEEDFSNSLNCLISLRNKDLRKALHILKKKKEKQWTLHPWQPVHLCFLTFDLRAATSLFKQKLEGLKG